MITQNNEAYMVNALGHHVPLDKVRPVDLLQDEMVQKIHMEAEVLTDQLRRFKENAFSEIKAFLDNLALNYNVAKGGSKGGVTLTSYDGLTKIIVATQDFISFGAELIVAKDIVDECLREWSEASQSENLRAVVEQAFEVNKNNRLNIQSILQLKRIDIADERWKKAMKAIDDSIHVERSKRYIRIYKRPSIDREFKAVLLDLAKV